MMLRRILISLISVACIGGQAMATTSSVPQGDLKTSQKSMREPIFSGELRLLGSRPSLGDKSNRAPIVAKIDISEQRMNVYVNGYITHSWKVSTAANGYYTPRGEYNPYRMHTMWRSRKYNNAPMPYAVFFHKGWAIHGTNAISRLGRPASHGCVRLHPDNAKTLFKLIKTAGGMKSAKVIISN
ncbi:L,D-transpeptidase [uncultured Cohaesibacter sp.]|uniref:L,D-transpeptidase n=1 Tax=uncultured Cohaesibacter sp. TaxID=1002546 RepID=UPI00292F14B8|nr:L,D-transpeptidase [uncultured Cohaesibacter sp.]